MTKKRAVILGATGLIGGELIKQLANSPDYKNIEVWVRKPSNNWPTNVIERVVNFDKLEKEQITADALFCCLGTTIKKAGSKEAFEKVDYEYPSKAAELAKKAKVPLFAIVTAMGSDMNSSIFYNKVKGKVENDLIQLDLDHLGIFRPSMLLGDRAEFRLGEAMGKVFMKIMKPLIPKKYQAIRASRVALAMLKYASKPQKGLLIIENQEML